MSDQFTTRAAVLRSLLAALLCAIVGSACSSGPAGQVQTGPSQSVSQPVLEQPADVQPGFGDLLPPPADLLAPGSLPRSASYAEEDLFRPGKFFDPALPNSGVSAPGDDAVFSPAWQPGGGTTGLSYCVFSFPAWGYDRALELHYSFATPPADWHTMWIGAADWAGGGWRWRAADAAGVLTTLITLDSFSGDGTVLVVFACNADGDTPALDWVHLGPPQVSAKIQIFIHDGIAPLQISADASGSTAGNGEITRYEWDWDGDGTFEDDTLDDPTAEHIYTDPGEFAPAVRVTTSLGASAVAATTLTVTAPWVHSWGGTEEDTAEAVAVDTSSDAVYFGGVSASYGQGGEDALLIRLDREGNLVWARTWGATNNDRLAALAVAADGSVYAAGTTQSYGKGAADCLIQHWTADGVLLWTHTWGSLYGDSLKDMALQDGNLYVAGASQVNSGPAGPPDALIAKFDPDGEISWAYTFGTANYDHLEGIAVVKPLFGEVEIYVTGTSNDNGADAAAIYGQFGDDGSDLAIRSWNGTGLSFGTAVVAIPYPAPTQVYIGGYADSAGGGFDGMLAKYQPSGNPPAWGWSMDGNLLVKVLSLAYADGRFFVGGSTAGLGSADRAFLTQITDTGTTLLSREYGSDSGVDGAIADLALFPGKGVIAAGVCALSVANAWENFVFIPRSFTGTWEDSGFTPALAEGDLYTVPGTVHDYTSIELDSGGGGSDGLFAVQPRV